MTLSLDLTRTSIDYERLLALAQESGAKAGLLSPELTREAKAVLGSCDGEVLPVWDELKQNVNGARGAGGDFIRQLSQQAEEARVTILGALAANHLARHEAARAIPLLERALKRQPDRVDLARKLRERPAWRLGGWRGRPKSNENTPSRANLPAARTLRTE